MERMTREEVEQWLDSLRATKGILDYEIESYDAKTGEAVVRIKVPPVLKRISINIEKYRDAINDVIRDIEKGSQ